MNLEALRTLPLLQALTDEQLRRLWDAGEEVAFEPGDVLFRSGRPADAWWLLLDGSLGLVRHVGQEDTVVGTMGTPGQWAGGFRAWDPNGVYMATGRASTQGRVLRVPAEELGAMAQAWFPFGVHLIRGLVQTVRGIESTARQREALVALGTLAAGLAHEINNPASAATRAVDALRESCDGLTRSLRGLVGAGLSADQLVELEALRGELRPLVAGSTLELADREEELTDWLVDHGVGEDWLLAPALTAAGADPAWCDRVAGLLGGADACEPALHWLASSVSTTTLLGEVKEATQRVSALVAAVRSYSQLDRASVQRTDVTECLESTLKVLGHKLHGMTITRRYSPDVPQIEAIPGELNQVWTNLIDNAIDATDGAGALRVSTSLSPEGVVVEIADDGPEPTDGVLAHVFEPFFTTKEVGRGTGLGLDISRRIVVERHGGDIGIERVAGETVVRVLLPAR